MMNTAHLPAYTQANIKNYLIENGCSGTIYALAFPESRRIIEEVIDGGNRNDIIDHIIARHNESGADLSTLADDIKSALATSRSEFTNIFEAAWTSRQDSVDSQFFEAWRNWSRDAVTIPEELWRHTYPTAGASEGLRQLINDYGQKARHDKFEPCIHVFDGEYEGFSAYAAAANIRVVRHDRNMWRDLVTAIGPNDQVYISQPSAIDGNIWEEFDEFTSSLSREQPTAKVILDLTYVGSVARKFHINADHDNIPAVVFSLSKPFGVYYHRIGGLLSRDEMPSLIGNKWFKNIQAIRSGTAILSRSSDPWELPCKYQPYRDAAIAAISRRIDINLEPSDVLLFATAPSDMAQTAATKSLIRGSLSQKFVRVCITPELASLIPGATILRTEDIPISLPTAAFGTAIGDLRP
jgi:hypothetical protein